MRASHLAFVAVWLSSLRSSFLSPYLYYIGAKKRFPYVHLRAEVYPMSVFYNMYLATTKLYEVMHYDRTSQDFCYKLPPSVPRTSVRSTSSSSARHHVRTAGASTAIPVRRRHTSIRSTVMVAYRLR